eukprot:TRINITY_DN2879_c0_g1_i2.p1 TRINITY_DN2879_c0_g1~~TRINITY_DN2879_c0_g1_i2.p1  ORF type:complete len:259 (-),score=49.55 TRINITY_DN2879_c0_g1_i2:130-906(-)
MEITAATVFLTVPICIAVIVHFATRKAGPSPPLSGPPTLLFFGNTLQILSNGGISRAHHWVYDMAQRYSSLFEVWLGPSRHVIVTDADQARKLLSLAPCSRPKAFRQKALKYLGTSGGLFFMEGDEWSRHRRMLSPLFTATRLREHVPKIVAHTRLFIEQLDAMADGDQSLDIDDKVQDLTLDILGDTHLGMQFNALAHPDGNPVKAAVRTRLEGALRRHLSVGVDFRTWFDRAEVKRFNQAVDYLNRLAMEAVHKCR